MHGIISHGYWLVYSINSNALLLWNFLSPVRWLLVILKTLSTNTAPLKISCCTSHGFYGWIELLIFFPTCSLHLSSSQSSGRCFQVSTGLTPHHVFEVYVVFSNRILPSGSGRKWRTMETASETVGTCLTQLNNNSNEGAPMTVFFVRWLVVGGGALSLPSKQTQK